MALVLVIGLTPIGSEVVEVAVHLVEHGDLSHYSGDDQPSDQEHGCSVLCQPCGHATAIPLPSPSCGATQPPRDWRVDFAPVPDVHGVAAAPPPHPPPIA
jgi:hypothetical protein